MTNAEVDRHRLEAQEKQRRKLAKPHRYLSVKSQRTLDRVILTLLSGGALSTVGVRVSLLNATTPAELLPLQPYLPLKPHYREDYVEHTLYRLEAVGKLKQAHDLWHPTRAVPC